MSVIISYINVQAIIIFLKNLDQNVKFRNHQMPIYHNIPVLHTILEKSKAAVDSPVGRFS